MGNKNTEKTVLAMYNVRGIQSYIFKSNKLKEIMGASEIVDSIITDGLRHIIKGVDMPEKYIVEWEDDSNTGLEFIKDDSIQMQVLFIGGGNAYVLYRTSTLCTRFNRQLARYVMDQTYSLNLAVAKIEKSNSYAKDYEKINDLMSQIKAEMVPCKPMGALPHMATDYITGDVLTAIDKDSGRYISTESNLKLQAYRQMEDKEEVNILEKMITKKGVESLLAVVHIDGNNTGKRIKEIMENKATYEEAIPTMRVISKNIKNHFNTAFDEMRKEVNTDKQVVRKVVLAGDDITFICNARVALHAVETFTKKITQVAMYDEKESQKYRFSVCAGIAYIYSHFPFSDAYVVAKECCASAKKEAKEHKIGDMIGNYLDFQLCNNIKAGNLKTYREKYYLSTDGTNMLLRPYFVDVDAKVFQGAEVHTVRSIQNFHDAIEMFTEERNGKRVINRAFGKRLKNAYYLGSDKVEKYVVLLQSKGIRISEEDMYITIEGKQYSRYYDALELMDLKEE